MFAGYYRNAVQCKAGRVRSRIAHYSKVDEEMFRSCHCASYCRLLYSTVPLSYSKAIHSTLVVWMNIQPIISEIVLSLDLTTIAVSACGDDPVRSR